MDAVDLGQHVAGLDGLAFREIDRVQLVVDPDLDSHCVEGLDGAKAGQIHGDALEFRDPDGSGNCLRIQARSFRLRAGHGGAHEMQSEEHRRCNHDDREHQDPTLAHIILPNLPRGATRPRIRVEMLVATISE